jgi:hypothetical protein
LDQSKVSKLIETLQKLISGSTTGSGTVPVHYEPNIQVFNEEPKEEEHKRAR